MKQGRLNNMKLSFLRREPLYEAIMTDLYLIGALEKDVAEKLIDRTIPDYLVNPLTGVAPGAESDSTE